MTPVTAPPETSPTPEAAPQPAGKLARLLARVKPLVPWVSLGVGVASAALMERGPKKALLVAVAATASWVSVAIFALLQNKDPEQMGPMSKRLLQAGRFGSVAAMQWAIQMSFWFAVPFFVHAMTWSPGHVGFVGVVLVAAVASLWDPLTERMMRHPGLATVLPALATFVGLLAVVPGFGISIEKSLWIAAGATTLGMPIAAAAGAPRAERGRFALAAAVVAALIPAALWAGAAQVVPAAPLRLMSADIGTTMIGRDLKDPRTEFNAKPWRLACATAIRAPLGLHDRLYHVWRKDGVHMDSIRLRVDGGRKEGFRTWSIKHNFGADPYGVWTCSVETEAGQRLGGARILVRRQA